MLRLTAAHRFGIAGMALTTVIGACDPGPDTPLRPGDPSADIMYCPPSVPNCEPLGGTELGDIQNDLGYIRDEYVQDETGGWDCGLYKRALEGVMGAGRVYGYRGTNVPFGGYYNPDWTHDDIIALNLDNTWSGYKFQEYRRVTLMHEAYHYVADRWRGDPYPFGDESPVNAELMARACVVHDP
jgi:hypothetical protein